MRKHLAQDFDLIYVLELGGNVRKNPTLSGTTHNVFGIQVGVSINLFIRLPKKAGAKRRAKIHYHAVPVDWRREQKYDFLNKAGSIAGVKWRRLHPDDKHNWLTNKTDGEFADFVPLGSKKYKARSNLGLPTIFRDVFAGRVHQPRLGGVRLRRRTACASASSSSPMTTTPSWIGGARRPSRRRTRNSWRSTSTISSVTSGSSGAETLKLKLVRDSGAAVFDRRPFARACTVPSPSNCSTTQKGVRRPARAAARVLPDRQEPAGEHRASAST